MADTKTLPKRRKFTPPEVAAQFGVATTKIVAWIASGELRAINGATKPSDRPRYLIDERDIEEFERRRAIVPVAAAPVRRRRRRSPGGVHEYF